MAGGPDPSGAVAVAEGARATDGPVPVPVPLPLPREQVPEEHAPPIEPSLRRRLRRLDAVVVAVAWLPVAVVGLAGPVAALVETAVVVALTLAALNALGLYRARVCVVRRLARRRQVAAAMVGPLVLAGAATMADVAVPTGRYAFGAAAVALALVVGREAFEQWLVASRVRGRYFRPVVVAGCRDEVERIVALVADHPETGFDVVGWIGDDPAPSTVPAMATVPWLGSLDAAPEVVRLTGVASVVVAPSAGQVGRAPGGPTGQVARGGPGPHGGLNGLAARLQASGTHVQVWTGLWSIDTRRLRAAPMAHEPFFYLEPAGAAVGKRWAKRAIDVAVASLALVLGSPLLLLIALAVKLGDRGPVLFAQTRVGHHGQTFSLHKFRTMSVDAERRLAELQAQNERSGPLFKVAHDPRVTPVGRVLRATSLDELPQLVDVLRGRLSLVGPRPALPAEVAEFDADLLRRHDVVPGMTGLWQVEARHNPSFDVYRRLDLFYVQNWTLGLDLVLLLATVKTVVTDAVREVTTAIARRWAQRREAADAPEPLLAEAA